MSDYGEIGKLLSAAIEQAFRDLISNRHLYQSAQVSLSPMDAYIQAEAVAAAESARNHPFSPSQINPEGAATRTFEELGKLKERAVAAMWDVTPGALLGVSGPRNTNIVYFDLPTIFTVCPNPKCNQRSPFNPHQASEVSGRGTGESVAADMKKRTQVFVCIYQCQSCKTEPLVFLVRREGQKLTLSGRSQIETVAAPSVIPKQIRKFYSDAMIAYNAGQTLPGLFMLRVVIEQFWIQLHQRQILILSEKRDRRYADKLADAYNQILPSDFKDRFPSLGKIYEDISERLHSATADAELFEKAAADIIEHFDARRLMKLDAEDEKRAAAITTNTKKSSGSPKK
jgi:hypothetical protein